MSSHGGRRSVRDLGVSGVRRAHTDRVRALLTWAENAGGFRIMRADTANDLVARGVGMRGALDVPAHWFDFARFRPKVVTVEHNFRSADQAALLQIFSEAGYVATFEEYPFVTEVGSWFVREGLVSKVE